MKCGGEDINNVYVSAHNHGYDPSKFLDAIPVGRVGEIHLAGHKVEEPFLIDTHDAPVCDDVWALYQRALRRFGRVSCELRWCGGPEFACLRSRVPISADSSRFGMR
jgi:uncharacterized protein (UPF0276 family)